ncbi:type I restriction enzyme, S subunit [Selenomonas ruminantium]|uniref:Type I restriction enzyme, S subunit n=1 Tax=Selenomonas ruminantium TaxID=971 RepID=A0A1M6SHU0_SELRU|nr:restriction endonuclease subunit S [Selenomonas ruminantium]SHK44364.1 type I restriction enzyme, S subunit [Selenomonas ruminantium]
MSTPKIRFNGFTDDWEQRKLDDVVDFLDTMRKPLEEAVRVAGPYPYYGASGIVDYVDGYIFDEELVLLSEDGANITDRNYPVCFLASGKYWVNNHAHVLKVKPGNENNFICNSLERKDFNQYNSGMAMPKLNKEVCKRIPLYCPKYEEQKKIGDYFRNLDNLIALQQRKCDKLQKVKKYMLQKMFPKKGEKVPEIRFAGFTGDWEQQKLGDVATFINGRAYSQDELLDEGKYKVLRVGNFYTNDSWYYSDMELGEKYYANKGDLLYTWSATFGPHIWNGDKVIYHYHIWKVDLSEKLDKVFALQLLEQDKATLLANTNGSTMIHVTKAGMEDKQVLLPHDVNEQAKIGAYLSNLDNRIALHQRKYDTLKEIKKYMLQNMFPKK